MKPNNTKEPKFKTGDRIIAIGPVWYVNKLGTIVNPCHYYNSSGYPVCKVKWDFESGELDTDTMDQSWLVKLTKLKEALL